MNTHIVLYITYGTLFLTIFDCTQLSIHFIQRQLEHVKDRCKAPFKI